MSLQIRREGGKETEMGTQKRKNRTEQTTKKRDVGMRSFCLLLGPSNNSNKQ